MYGVNYGFEYFVPKDALVGTTDKFKYTLCIDNVCKEANVTINFR
jgi:hypothetical protein